MLSPGLGNMCMESSQAMKHDLWQNQLWLRRKAAAERDADSDEDDTEQFGIQEGAAEDAAEGADDADGADEEEGGVYPLYGQDDSDFGDSSSDVSAWGLLSLQCSALHGDIGFFTALCYGICCACHLLLYYEGFDC